jgi:uncharacterized membrane protein YfcA
VSPAWDGVLLAAAGVLAGVVGTAGGITSLVSYPALLLAGVPALQANVANIVALVACWPGSAAASRPELAGRGPWLRRWTVVAAAGGAAGSVLLLVTPAGTFAVVVPFLVAGGSVALLLQPRLAASPGEPGRGGRKLLLPSGLAAVSAYSGYFGAGSGVMVLALMLATADPVLPRANALKNMLVGAATFASAAILVVLARVNWAAVVPLAAGLLAGSAIGPAVARRISPGVLRWLVALSGLGLAARLWVAGG